MPTYYFECTPCKIKFEDICSFAERENVNCPKCGNKPEKLMTAPLAIMFTNLKGTSKEDNFGYVAQENYENAQRQRRYAESHNPHGYSYDDLGDIEKYEGKMADIDPFEKG